MAAIVPAERIRAAVDMHFPDAQGKVDQALAASPGGTWMQQLMSAPDGRAVEFLALHRTMRELPPPVPDTVFEPSGTRPARLNNLSPRSDMTRYPQEQRCLVIRAAALRPGDAVQVLHGGGSAASKVDDARREKLLTEIARGSGLSTDLAAFCTPRGLGQLPADWTYQGEGGWETSRLFLEAPSWSADAPSLRAELSFTTGWASQGLNQPQIETIQGHVDIAVRLPANADGLSLAEVRDLLVTAARLFEITRKAGQLLPERPYDDGDGALWIVTNQPAFDQVIDLQGFERAAPNTGWTEVWLNTTLPLTEHADPLLGAGRQLAPPGTALAVEAVKRLLQGANLRGYEPALHDLLQVGAVTAPSKPD